jgi:hypothetical protein
MMTVCFLPYEQNYKDNMKKKSFRYIQPITIICKIGKEELSDLIKNILVNNCELDVYGFNRITDEYWGKKIEKTVNKLHFNLSIYKKEYYSSYITITPFVGTNIEIQKLLFKILGVVKLYENNAPYSLN